MYVNLEDNSIENTSQLAGNKKCGRNTKASFLTIVPKFLRSFLPCFHLFYIFEPFREFMTSTRFFSLLGQYISFIKLAELVRIFLRVTWLGCKVLRTTFSYLFEAVWSMKTNLLVKFLRHVFIFDMLWPKIKIFLATSYEWFFVSVLYEAYFYFDFIFKCYKGCIKFMFTI